MAQAMGCEVTGYRLVVPAEWAGLDLDPERRDRSVKALVNRQFAGLDNVPHLKRQAKRDLLARAEATHAAGGIELFLSMQRVADVPIAASLATFLIPPDDGRATGADRLAQVLGDDHSEVTLRDLPVGRAARVLRRSGPADAPDSVILEVFVPVPRAGWWLLLTFAAPTGPLVPAMIGLFDAICTTLRWDC